MDKAKVGDRIVVTDASITRIRYNNGDIGIVCKTYYNGAYVKFGKFISYLFNYEYEVYKGGIMKFKKGDKVVVSREDIRIPKGTVLTVRKGPAGPDSGGNYYFEEHSSIALGDHLIPAYGKEHFEMLLPLKIQTATKEVSELVQEKFFEMGCRWSSGRVTIAHTADELLYLGKNKHFTCGSLIENFLNCTYNEITLTELMKFSAPVEPLVEITVKMNGKECKLSDISEETLKKLRSLS